MICFPGALVDLDALTAGLVAFSLTGALVDVAGVVLLSAEEEELVALTERTGVLLSLAGSVVASVFDSALDTFGRAEAFLAGFFGREGLVLMAVSLIGIGGG